MNKMTKTNRQRIVILYTCVPSIILFTWRQYINFPEDPIWGSLLICLIGIPICSYIFWWLACTMMSDEHPERVWICYVILLTIFYWIFINKQFISDNWWTCYDKTTIDWNWQNDIKCINENGDVRRTDYEWAKKLMWK